MEARDQSSAIPVAGTGGASVPGDPTSVWSYQGPLSWLGQEQRAAENLVRPVESVSGATTVGAGRGKNMPGSRKKASG